MNPSLCLFHRADFDGVCSAAIVKKFVPDCELWGIDYGDEFPWGHATDGPEVLAEDLLAGAAIPRRTVYLLDFSLPPADMKLLAGDVLLILGKQSDIDKINEK